MTFELGEKLAELAKELDDNNIEMPEHMRYSVCLCIETMHNTAKLMLGDRAREVYCEDELGVIPQPALFAAADEAKV